MRSWQDGTGLIADIEVALGSFRNKVPKVWGVISYLLQKNTKKYMK